MNNGIKGWSRAGAMALAIAMTACGTTATDTDASDVQDAAVAMDTNVSPCGAAGVFGTYTGVNGGQGGVTACGRMFTTFMGATLTITPADGGGALLTVTGTGDVGDTTNCPAMVNDCTITATGCASAGTGGTTAVSYSLNAFTHQISGTAMPSLPGPGGGCSFTYSLDGTR